MPVITKPNLHFNPVLYAGNGGTQTVSGVGFQPDLTWIKSRGSGNNNCLVDSIRGAGYVLYSDSTSSESNLTSYFTGFNSDGFSFALGGGAFNAAYNYVSWNWKAASANTTNTDGSITSTVRVNQTAGFSIVSYASGSAGQKTVGHGLGVTPSMIITKSRDNASYNWAIYHSSVIDTTSKFLRFTTDAIVTSSTIWGAALPTSTVFGITSDNGVPANNNCIAYCWAPVAGYSAFGTYTGNGSADGPFVYTGFRPRFIMVKCTSNSENWYIGDGARQTFNASTNPFLNPNLSDAESNAFAFIDLTSNGFKCRFNGADTNGSGRTYIYAAFAEAPFKYANAR